MKPTLLILAAGMASRYGSMKQIQSFGPSGETIMDYSIYDAIQSGFGKIVFIIRKEFANDFKNIFEPKWGKKVETAYVYQEMESFTGRIYATGGPYKTLGNCPCRFMCEARHPGSICRDQCR